MSATNENREVWFYDGVTRTLYDENRLAVARDVGEADAFTILQAVRSPAADECGAIDASPGPHPLFAILDDMLAWEAESFDGPEDEDLQVSGADLVDAFTEWRQQIRESLAEIRPPAQSALLREAAALFREYEAHHRAQADAIDPEAAHNLQTMASDVQTKTDRTAKAERNAKMAERLEAAVGGSED